MTALPRLLVVSRYGHEASTRPEAEIYLALRRRGYAITIATDVESVYTRRFRESGIHVLLAHPEQRRDEGSIAALRAELLRQPYDVLMLYNSRAIANGVRAAKGIEGLTVVAYRGYAGDLRWYDPVNYLKIYHPRVDAILCNNRGVQAHIQANRWWARRDITHVVTKGHDLDWYEQVDPIDQTTLGVPAGAAMLVCVANAAKFKGVPYLLQAMQLLPEDPNIHLVLCGRNMDVARHRQLAEESPYPERIHFPGYREDVFRIVRAATLKVLPSITGESLTKAVFEAMAIGTPVLITDIPGNEELVEHGVSGWKVPARNPAALAEAILHLVGDASFRENLAQGAKKRLEGVLSHQATVEAMDAFFQGLSTGKEVGETN